MKHPGVIKDAVKEHYADLARRADSCCAGGQNRDSRYDPVALQLLPQPAAQASAGCGTPVAFGELRRGDSVLDLGSGGGIDCFLAADQVGPDGKVVGLDLTPAMVKLARKNARVLRVRNVEFRLADIEQMPVKSRTIDLIISNCVINLSPDKYAVFAEAFRVLRSGGRICVSDIVLMSPLPDGIRDNIDSWAECVSGALPKDLYLSAIRSAGFTAIEVLEERRYETTRTGADIATVTVRAIRP